MNEFSNANKEAYFARREKIAAAFSCLNVVDSGDGIPYITVVPDKYARWWRVSDQSPPRYTDATETETAKQIAKLRKSLDVLLDGIDSLNQPAYDALTANFLPGISKFRLQIIALNMAALSAKPIATKKRGRPIGSVAPDLVSELAGDFEMLTAERPTLTVNPDNGEAGGDFFCLVETVFKVLGVEGSPEAAIRKIIYGEKPAKNKD